MKVYLGPFHPNLEDAFVDEVQRYKVSDRLTPLLVLVPSEEILRRLQYLLTLDHSLDLINFRIWTFHQLSRQLYEEKNRSAEPNLCEDLFLEESLRSMIRKDYDSGSSFFGLDEMEGGCAALWQTLRDLKDGLVSPDLVIQAVKEGHFGKEAISRLSELLELYLDFQERCKAWSVKDYTDLDLMVTDQIPVSKFLKQFHHIFYYGFYDLTQVQTDLFQAVARSYPTTLFFPLVKGHSGWVFSQKFYDSNVQNCIRDQSLIIDLKKQQPTTAPVYDRLFSEALPGEFVEAQKTTPSRITFISCSGTQDETLTVAKEILRIVSEDGISFGDIGVVARTLSAYANTITNIFQEYKIPVSSAVPEEVIRFPLTKTILLLTGLSYRNYLRSEVIDLLTSPYLNTEDVFPEGIIPCPDLWDKITRIAGVTRGMEKWKGLKRCIEKDERQHDSETKDQADCLWQIFKALHQDLSVLPAKASWSVYGEHWKRLFMKYFNLVRREEKPEERGGKKERESGQQKEDEIGEVILDTLESLSALDAFISPVSLHHFIETFRRWLERASVKMTKRNTSGVAVMDAMAARGVPFKVLFLLGINEGVFPRAIREDAFLRDAHRRVLETTLGYKVGEKLAAYDEEKLLFTLLVASSREQLYCLYQRSDEQGKSLYPSWYLGELKRVIESKNQHIEHVIPRGRLEKEGVAPFNRADLKTPGELAVFMALSAQDLDPIIARLSLPEMLYAHGHQALKRIEDEESLNPIDGIVGPLPDYWKSIQEKGVSSTALEEYALCPFKYYSTRLLGLSLVERPEESDEIKPLGTGELCHDILKEVYTFLMAQGYFQNKASWSNCGDIVLKQSRKIFSRYESEHPVSYAVVWEDLKERIVDLIQTLIKHDRLYLLQSGYVPLALELKCESRLEGGFPIQGRLDRIDYHAEEKRYRVIDYKYKMGKNQNTEDKNLMQAAVRGQRLQPPVYLLLAKQYAAVRDQDEDSFPTEVAFYFLAPNWEKGPIVVSEFPANGWEGEAGLMLKNTFNLLLEGIQKGRFFIHPGSHCEYCDMSTICRLNHLQSSRRAAEDPLTRAHQSLSKLKSPKTPKIKRKSKSGN